MTDPSDPLHPRHHPGSTPQPQMIDTLARAFHDDPAFRWMCPDEASRSRRLDRFFRWVLADFSASGLVIAHEGDVAVTLWRRPGTQSTQRPRSLQELMEGLAIFGLRLGRAMRVAEAVHRHLPTEQDFLYLQFAAVHPSHQGQGLGPRTIQQGLTLADQMGVDTYLETSSPSNVALYQRLGFQVTEHWQVPGDGPAFWTMKRPCSPRASRTVSPEAMSG